jgi:hypothetical protein
LKVFIPFGLTIMLFIALNNLPDELQCSDLTTLHFTTGSWLLPKGVLHGMRSGFSAFGLQCLFLKIMWLLLTSSSSSSRRSILPSIFLLTCL